VQNNGNKRALWRGGVGGVLSSPVQVENEIPLYQNEFKIRFPLNKILNSNEKIFVYILKLN